MNLIEEIIFTSKQVIIDADCKKEDLIVLLKNTGENTVQLNGELILTLPKGHHIIRFTKDHFCLLYNTTLSFYSLTGKFVSEFEVGSHIHELFPYKDGVLCTYGDEGVYGEGIGNNILNYVSPFSGLESFYNKAIHYNLDYNPLFARYKPYAGINPERNELVLLNEQLEEEKTMKIPFDTGNLITFALTYKYGLFIEENKLCVWEFETTKCILEYKREFSSKIRAIFHRHDFSFIEISDYEVKGFMPVVEYGT
ncbi:hypothetical protein [Bacillus sp. E214]|uniref:hypothetical protein n=1 Tax=Bacillus sp. E214 TaxID=2587156 RepID=UPI0011DF4DD0|nr:hypothetical protein [Bacillus sp. E214]